MAIRIQTQATPFASYTDRDPASLRIANLKLVISYSHPAMLTWTMYAEQHTMPLTPGHLLRLWDDAANDPDGSPYSASNPLFEGHIQTPQPGPDTFTVQYTAYDPTYRAQNETNVMSYTWEQGTVPGTKPTEGAGTYPRLVFNASAIANDDDVAFSRAENQTISQIIATIFDDQYHPLYWISAAPGDGTSAGNGSPYVSGDLSGMTYEPQEKLVFESENVLSAMTRMLTWEPNYRCMWRPGTRKWRFFDITAGTASTLTLNDFTGAKKVLSFTLDRSLEGRYTAVKIYGPETLTPFNFQTADLSLTPLESSAVVLEVLGSVNIVSYRSYQITDPDKRRIGRLLPAKIPVGMGGTVIVETFSPVLQMSWDGGNSWATVLGAYFDFVNGIATCPAAPFIYTSEGQVVTTGIQHYFPPTDVRFIAAYFDEAISVRKPTSGHEGTAYSVVGLQNEMKLYDEMLAVDYTWYGTPITTAARLTKFAILTQKLLDERKNIVYTGGAVLDGIVYDYAHLNRRIYIDAIDEDGNNIATGWESSVDSGAHGSYLTDVEYDFEQGLTTLQFSSDQMELFGVDVERMKQRLKIIALERREWFTVHMTAQKRRIFTTFNTPVIGADWQATSFKQAGYFDPRTGKLEEGV